MKRWAILTACLYALAIITLAAPVALLAFGGWAKDSLTLSDVAKAYQCWGYWVWLAILVAGQSLLLLLPISIAERRQPARRPVKIPVIVTAFFLANLVLAGLISLLCALFREDGLEIFSFVDRLLKFYQHQPSSSSNTSWGGIVSIGIITVVFWIIWGIIFRRATQADEPGALLKRLTRWLLRGSILELLIAVPSHIIVRRREDCCAPFGTFWGIATGISVMLLCFGPGVFFLFAERCRKLKPQASPEKPD